MNIIRRKNYMAQKSDREKVLCELFLGVWFVCLLLLLFFVLGGGVLTHTEPCFGLLVECD